MAVLDSRHRRATILPVAAPMVDADAGLTVAKLSCPVSLQTAVHSAAGPKAQ